MADALTCKLAHLHRRAGFGARPDELATAAAAGYEATVERLLDRTVPDPAADALVPPTVTPVLVSTVETLEERKARTAQRAENRRLITTWWLERMIAAQSPLREKLVWFWHTHFATSIEKVREAQPMLAQNQLFRTLGAGNFETLAQAVAKDGAMMIWLDSNQNRKGAPNENFARELMELFTIGIGNYADLDVREAARAFTGWRTDRIDGVFHLQPNQGDAAPKTVLGQVLNTGEQVVTLLARHPAAARFVAAKIWSRFAWPVRPDDPIVSDISASFANDGDVTGLVRRVLLHPLFDSPTARQGLVKEPVEYVVGTLRSLNMSASSLDLASPTAMRALQQLGQVPFEPPSVGGWPQNGYFVSTATSLARLRFANTVANTASPTQLGWLTGSAAAQRPDAIARQLAIDGFTPATIAALNSPSLNPKQQLAIALVSPEYVLN